MGPTLSMYKYIFLNFLWTMRAIGATLQIQHHINLKTKLTILDYNIYNCIIESCLFIFFTKI